MPFPQNISLSLVLEPVDVILYDKKDFTDVISKDLEMGRLSWMIRWGLSAVI